MRPSLASVDFSSQPCESLLLRFARQLVFGASPHRIAACVFTIADPATTNVGLLFRDCLGPRVLLRQLLLIARSRFRSTLRLSHTTTTAFLGRSQRRFALRCTLFGGPHFFFRFRRGFFGSSFARRLRTRAAAWRANMRARCWRGVSGRPLRPYRRFAIIGSALDISRPCGRCEPSSWRTSCSLYRRREPLSWSCAKCASCHRNRP